MNEDPQAVRDRIARFFRVEPGVIRVRRSTKPACWSWPAPETCTFKGDAQAEAFLFYWHHDCCAACGGRGDLVLDHDHRTALIRGYLCRSCNLQEPHAYPDSLLGRYRDRNSATILGIQVRYWSLLHGYAEPHAHRPQELGASPVYRLAALLGQTGDIADAG